MTTWTLYSKQPDGRYLRDDSLEADERYGLQPDALIAPRPEAITLGDGRQVDAQVGDGGLALVPDAA